MRAIAIRYVNIFAIVVIIVVENINIEMTISIALIVGTMHNVRMPLFMLFLKSSIIPIICAQPISGIAIIIVGSGINSSIHAIPVQYIIAYLSSLFLTSLLELVFVLFFFFVGFVRQFEHVKLPSLIFPNELFRKSSL